MTPTPGTLDAALGYAARGWRVVPILPGEKRPALNDWVNKATTDTDLITEWWEAHPDHGIGLVTGRESGIFVVDIDGEKGAATLRELEAKHGNLPPTFSVKTGGGYHLYFRYPDFEIRNDAAKRLGPGLDIRGEGGQVVAPPTIHPSGEPYRWLDEFGQIADAPEWLLDLLRSPETATQDSVAIADDRPGDRFNAAMTWQLLLNPDGWTHHHKSQDSTTHWTRPGKETREGSSATTGHSAADTLYVFTSSVPGLDAATAYTKFGYLAATKFGGDHAAATRALAKIEESEGMAAWSRQVGTATPSMSPSPVVVEGDRRMTDVGAIESPDDDETTNYVVRDIGEEWRNPTAGGVPTVGAKDDGTRLFYAGCVNGIHGGPGSGKSWVCAEMAKQELRLGHAVLWLDMEDSSPRVIVERLKMIAVTEKQATGHFHYINPNGRWPLIADVERLVSLIVDKGITLVIIDSVGEMMATNGLDGNDDGAVATFLQHVARKLAGAGAAVVLLDHVTKAGENKLWPTGSQRKLAGITGAAYLLETSRPFSKDEPGSARLVCAKDRHGATGRTSEAAWIKFTPMPDGGLEIDIRASEKKTEAERAARSLEKHGRDVYKLLEAADDGLGTNELQARAQLTRQKITAAVEWLVRLELVAVVDGANRKKMHQVTGKVPPWLS